MGLGSEGVDIELDVPVSVLSFVFLCVWAFVVAFGIERNNRDHGIALHLDGTRQRFCELLGEFMQHSRVLVLVF